jgi:hypothetical protein
VGPRKSREQTGEDLRLRGEAVSLVEGPLGKALVAARDIHPGEAVLSLTGEVVEHPDRFTIQIGEGRHLRPEGHAWAYLNHACDPTCAVDVPRMAVVALRPIPGGEELTFNYLTTEWRMAAPFPCGCRSKECLGLIAGMSSLEPAVRRKLRPLCSPYIASLIDAEPR